MNYCVPWKITGLGFPFKFLIILIRSSIKNAIELFINQRTRTVVIRLVRIVSHPLSIKQITLLQRPDQIIILVLLLILLRRHTGTSPIVLFPRKRRRRRLLRRAFLLGRADGLVRRSRRYWRHDHRLIRTRSSLALRYRLLLMIPAGNRTGIVVILRQGFRLLGIRSGWSAIIQRRRRKSDASGSRRVGS